MRIIIHGTVVHLQGDLNKSGVTKGSINSLAVSLEQMGTGRENTLRIDCTRINVVDSSGLQLLYAWMQCVRFRGFKPVLVNLSASLQQAIQRIGAGHCFADALA